MNKTMRRRIGLFAAAAALLIGMSCAPNVEAKGGKVKNVKVANLPAKALTLKKGKSKKLKVKVTTKGKASKAVTFRSSRPKVVKVDKKGKVTAKGTGKAKVTITAKGKPHKKAVIQVTVGTPVSRVSLNKKSVQVTPGGTIKLSASVSPKKASNKKVIWSSSNPKAARVSAGGTVKGISAGTARITAEAADGSGKKAAAAVTVRKAAVTIGSIKMINSYAIQVNLTAAQKLNKNNFTVKASITGKKYNKVCKIDYVTTNNNKNYWVILDDYIATDDKVMVTVAGLYGKGTDSRTATYRPDAHQYNDTVIYKVNYNQDVEESFYCDDGYGYRTYTVTGLPKGVTYSYDEYEDELYFSGRPNQAGKISSKVVVKDEIGNVYTTQIIWLVGSENTLCAAATPVYKILDSYGDTYLSRKISVSGGSGSYQYELNGSGNPAGFEVGIDGDVEGEVTKAGTYKVSVKVMDSDKLGVSTTVDVIFYVAASSVKVSGTVKDAVGNPLEGAEIEFTNKDYANPYDSEDYAETNSKGAYSINLMSGTYDVNSYFGGTNRYYFSQAIRSNKTLNFTLPVQGQWIEIKPDKAGVDLAGISWYDEKNNYVGSGTRIYLIAGKHSLHASLENAGWYGSAEINNVAAAGSKSLKSVTAKIKIDFSGAGTIQTDRGGTVNIADQYQFFTFRPSQAGTYKFEFQCDEYDSYTETECILCDEEGRVCGSSWGEPGFELYYECEADKDYYLGVRTDSDGDLISGTLSVSLAD